MELTPQQLSAEVKGGKARPVYLLLGEDGSARAAAVQSLKEALNPGPFDLSEVSGDSAEEVVGAALTPPMLSPRRLVVVGNPNPRVDVKKALSAYLEDPLETTTLVLHSEDRKPDIRDALTAGVMAAGGVVVFRALTEDAAATRLRQAASAAGFELDEEAASWMVEEAGTSWGVLKAELDKMVLYARGRKRLTREDALACLGYRQASNPFGFPRVLQSRDRVKALTLLRRLLDEGTDEFRVLFQITGTLLKQLKAKRMVAAGLPEAQILRDLRLNAYYDKDFLREASKLSEASLVRSLKDCLTAETSLKSKSWLEPRIELERLVASVCR